MKTHSLTFYNCENNPVRLVKQIKEGGEGQIWETELSGYLAKIYRAPDSKKLRKLLAMLAQPPENPTVSPSHTAIAWPTDLLKDEQGNFVGFLMPQIQQAVNLLTVCIPKERRKYLPGFNWKYLHVAAKNYAWIVQNIHAKDYVLGDIKLENALVNNRALISVVDTDSFQIRDHQDGTLHRCPVGSIEFTPPELVGKNIPDIAQVKANDNFRLAVVIHYLLFGQHPFRGSWHGNGEPPGQDECIVKGLWPYAQNQLIRATENTIPLETAHPRIKELFLKCFNDGHSNPNLRPSAREWVKAMEVAINDLQGCQQVNMHLYSKTNGLSEVGCYWCARKITLGSDVFGPSQSVEPIVETAKIINTNLPPSQSEPIIAIVAGIVILLILLLILSIAH
jgi:DNA-binding helix-hairpin-helix protein with protein kinase domain